MAKSSKKDTVKVNRSAVTGRFVTKTAVKQNPRETVTETIKKGRK